MLATVGAVYGAVKKLPRRNSRRYSPPCITARRGGRAIKKISRSIRRSPRSASAQPQERTGWFSDENKRKTTPSRSASVASRKFLDDADTLPCGDARRGIALIP